MSQGVPRVDLKVVFMVVLNPEVILKNAMLYWVELRQRPPI